MLRVARHCGMDTSIPKRSSTTSIPTNLRDPTLDQLCLSVTPTRGFFSLVRPAPPPPPSRIHPNSIDKPLATPHTPPNIGFRHGLRKSS
jgi:hypothetical protein